MDVKCDIKASADLNPVISALAKGLRKLFALPFSKTEANSARHLALMAAQTEHDRELIYQGKATYIDDVLVPVEAALSGPESILQVEQKQELKNYIGTLQMATEALKDIPDEQVSDKDVDDDFFARWRREAKSISNKNIQRLWGKLLAEEIKEPNSISFRALDVLKNITSEEAKLFQSISHYILPPGIVVCHPIGEVLPPGVTFESLLLLHDCGLTVNIDSGVVGYAGKPIIIDGIPHMAIDVDGILFAAEYRQEEITIPGIPITPAGKIAFRVCDKNPQTATSVEHICGVIMSNKNNNFDKISLFTKSYENDVLTFTKIHEVVRQNS